MDQLLELVEVTPETAVVLVELESATPAADMREEQALVDIQEMADR